MMMTLCRVAAFLLFFSSFPVWAATLSEKTVADFEGKTLTPNRWLVVGQPGGKQPAGASVSLTRKRGQVRQGKGALLFRYARGKKVVPLLVFTGIIRGFAKLSFWGRSQEDELWILSIKDLDGAVFSARVLLKAGVWKKVSLLPSHFTCNRESPVQKPHLDTTRLLRGIAGFGLNAVPQLKKSGSNSVTIDQWQVTGPSYRVHRGAYIVSGRKTLRKPLWIKGPLVLRPGSRLRVLSKRFVLEGPLWAKKNSRLVMKGGVWRFKQAYRYQHRLTFDKGSRLVLEKGVWWGHHMQAVIAVKKARLRLQQVRMLVRGWTLNLHAKASLSMKKVKGLGEILLYDRSSFKAVDSSGVMLWLRLRQKFKKPLVLPSTAGVLSWSPKHLRRKLACLRCKKVHWGLILDPNSRVVVKNSKLRAVGFFFTDTQRATFSKLHNRRLYGNRLLKTKVHHLRLINTSVHSWNFYTHKQAELTLKQCTFGETISFGRSMLIIKDSLCDGSGGYLGARGMSTTLLQNSRVQGLVLLHDRATLHLTKTILHGDLVISGRSRVFQRDSTVKGQTLRKKKR